MLIFILFHLFTLYDYVITLYFQKSLSVVVVRDSVDEVKLSLTPTRWKADKGLLGYVILTVSQLYKTREIDNSICIICLKNQRERRIFLERLCTCRIDMNGLFVV